MIPCVMSVIFQNEERQIQSYLYFGHFRFSSYRYISHKERLICYEVHQNIFITINKVHPKIQVQIGEAHTSYLIEYNYCKPGNTPRTQRDTSDKIKNTVLFCEVVIFCEVEICLSYYLIWDPHDSRKNVRLNLGAVTKLSAIAII